MAQVDDVVAFSGWLATLHHAPDMLRLCQRLHAQTPTYFCAQAASVFVYLPGGHCRYQRFNPDRVAFDVIERRAGVVATAWDGEPGVLTGTGGLDPESAGPVHFPDDQYGVRNCERGCAGPVTAQ